MLNIVDAKASTGFSVAICGESGAGKTFVAAQTKGQLWLQTESNGIGTIREGKTQVAFAKTANDLLEPCDPDIPVIIPIYGMPLEQRAKTLLALTAFIEKNAEKIKEAGRSTIILDSLSDLNSLVVDWLAGEAKDDVDKLDHQDWYQVQKLTLRPVQRLRGVTNCGLDLAVIMGIKPMEGSFGSSTVRAGYIPLIQGGARDRVLFMFMACCTINTKVVKGQDGKPVVERQAAFIGRQGRDIFKPKGRLGLEPCNFYDWKRKAFEGV